jgi:hypothetical protein
MCPSFRVTILVAGMYRSVMAKPGSAMRVEAYKRSRRARIGKIAIFDTGSANHVPAYAALG